MSKKILLIMALVFTSWNSFALQNKFACKFNASATRVDNPDIAKIEKNLEAEIEIPNKLVHDLKPVEQNNLFKFKNIEAYKHQKYDYVEKVLDSSDDLILKDLPMKTDFHDDQYDYYYTRKTNGVKIFIFTQDFKVWRLQIMDPQERNDYLAYFECH